MTTRQPTPGLHENFAKEVEAPGTTTDTAQLIEALESAGAGMANICFNLSQDAALPASVRQSMKTGQMQWDAAIRALRAARAAPTPPPQSHVVGLRPCPFCYGNAEFERVGTSKQSTIVVCTDCGARLETSETFNAGQRWNDMSAAMEAAYDEFLKCDSTEDDLTDCFRHHITTTIGWLAFGARPGPEMQMYEEGFKAGYRRCQSDNEPELGEEEDALSARARKLVGKLRESIKSGAVQLADVEDAIDLIIDQSAQPPAPNRHLSVMEANDLGIEWTPPAPEAHTNGWDAHTEFRRSALAARQAFDHVVGRPEGYATVSKHEARNLAHLKKVYQAAREKFPEFADTLAWLLWWDIATFDRFAALTEPAQSPQSNLEGSRD